MRAFSLIGGMCLLGTVSAVAVAADNQSTGAEANRSSNAKLMPSSISRQGDMARFEVVNSGGNGQADRVRYVVDCKQRTLAVAARADTSGGTPEVDITPPRQADWSKPGQGSIQAHWVDQACRG